MPRLPELGPEDPGPFSFADEARVRRILGRAGFADDRARRRSTSSSTSRPDRVSRAAIATAQSIGAASRALEGQPEDVRAAAVAEIRAALAPHRARRRVPLGAAIWIVEAINP